MGILELYPKYFEILTRYCMKMTGNRTEAEDLTQEAFMRAFSDKERFEGMDDAAQRAWLNRTARNLFIDQARRRSRAPHPILPAQEEPDLTRIPVAQALEQLEPGLYRMVVLRYFAGFTSTEIGAMSGIPPATVRTRLRAAAKQLKKYYGLDQTQREIRESP